MTEKRVAIVTGGARGIGLAVARALAKDGLAVAIGDIDEGKAREDAEAIRAPAGRRSAGAPTWPWRPTPGRGATPR